MQQQSVDDRKFLIILWISIRNLNANRYFKTQWVAYWYLMVFSWVCDPKMATSRLCQKTKKIKWPYIKRVISRFTEWQPALRLFDTLKDYSIQKAKKQISFQSCSYLWEASSSVVALETSSETVVDILHCIQFCCQCSCMLWISGRKAISRSTSEFSQHLKKLM